MPKLKTHRGAAKRFKKTATDKFLRLGAFKRHLLTGKTRKQKRHLSAATPVAPADRPRIQRMLPYK